MSATNLTKNLKLSQFVASDKPSWLGDVNGDNKKIDDGYGVLAGEISKANDTASSAKSQSDANTQTLTNVNSELEDYGNRITALEAGGGTENLEQRVNTLGTDVEALKTRADTFEEDITQNSTDITALKSRVDTIEPKVKANADNITSLQSTTMGLNTTVESLAGDLNKNKTNTQTALNNSAEALTKANNNEQSIGEINSRLDTIGGVDVRQLTVTASQNVRNTCSYINMYVNTAFKQISFDTLFFKTFSDDFSTTKQVCSLTLPSEYANIITGASSSDVATGLMFVVGSSASSTSGALNCYATLSGQTLTIYCQSAGVDTEHTKVGFAKIPTMIYA